MMKNIVSGGFTSIEQAAGGIRRSKGANAANSQNPGASFQEILEKKAVSDEAVGTANVLKFSKHAGARLEQRDIRLTEEQLLRLTQGTQKAGMRGIKESLVLMDNMAFIVNTQNNTVVTAMDQDMNEENIFTNIDGAVII